jgi:hypothetical protein
MEGKPMNCKNCANRENCYFADSGYYCADFAPVQIGPTPAELEQLEKTGEAGFWERPRVPFSVFDF